MTRCPHCQEPLAMGHKMTPLLKTKDVAAILGLTDETVLSYANRGILPGFRLPHGVLRFRQEDVDRWLEQHAVGAERVGLREVER